MLEPLIQRLQAGDISGLQGTNIAIELPISARLLEDIFAARPADGALKELSARLLSQNRAILSIGADVPMLGHVRRELSLVLDGEYDRQHGGHIIFHIIDGLRSIDKPIINLLQRQIESKLPAGIDLNSRQIIIEPARLFNALGLTYLLPLLAGAKLAARKDQLVLFLHLKA